MRYDPTMNFTQLSFHFTNISYSNKLPNKVGGFQSAVLLVYVDNVTFEQIDDSNHDSTCSQYTSSSLLSKIVCTSTIVNN